MTDHHINPAPSRRTQLLNSASSGLGYATCGHTLVRPGGASKAKQKPRSVGSARAERAGDIASHHGQRSDATRCGGGFAVTLVVAVSTLTVGPLVASGTAQAQCNTGANPPPPAPISETISNQTFGALPARPYNNGFSSVPGCAGSGGGSGSPGQPGRQLTILNSTLYIAGGTANPPDLRTIGVLFGSGGGAGGAGGGAQSSGVTAGLGAAGGTGGLTTGTFSGIVTLPLVQPGFLADSGIVVFSSGGGGGGGGDSNTGGIFIRLAGDAGPGGPGGAASLTAQGSIQAQLEAIRVSSFGGIGGSGGNATTTDVLSDTVGGKGAAGGAAGTASLNLSNATVQSSLFGLIVQAGGGGGGGGGSAAASAGVSGGKAGDGGTGGTATATIAADATVAVTQAADILVPGAGLLVQANGGGGGRGGQAGTALGAGGGSGGNGGAGGIASATVLGRITYDGAGVKDQLDGSGILVQANGGSGGAGANVNSLVGQGGGGGFAGAGGNASLTLGNAASTATVRTSGFFTHGALVQSVGGAGGNGGSANFFAAGGGGAAGGDGGAVTITSNNADVRATGLGGVALLAQSVGGGGGSGGDASGVAIGASFAIGGNGGLGGNGSTVNLNLPRGLFASTDPLGGTALLAQSIGGAGGAGGSVQSKGVGLLSLVIGGDGGNGGSAGAVTVNNGALVTTRGAQALGLQAQSIGGGGGTGGAAFGFQAGAIGSSVIAVGGRGGSGGPAGNVTVTNTGQLTTYGANAYGLLTQSIGGGGGSGGAAAARSVAIGGGDIPAISIAVATGGKGGTGNTAGTINVTNSGLVTTAGDAAIGVVAQSVGGGGGTGGDATAVSFASGPQSNIAISASVAVGGSGGTGGTGGQVTMGNEGLIVTLGQDAHGLLAHSVGGGGGVGGAGDASGTADATKGSVAVSIAVGGTGGTGGHGGVVSQTNGGSVVTSGDAAHGMVAQSVGGGGGMAGGGTATASGGSLALAVGVGGSGGAGGDGGAVTGQNTGNILTRGTDSIGLMVQSIGGGGGTGGKAGATAGGTSPFSTAGALFDTLGSGLGFNQTVTDIGDGIIAIGTGGETVQATSDELRKILAQPQAEKPEASKSPQFNVGVAVGGRGGAAGTGGAVSATNTGSIETWGAQADGIYAQSVGGGGGSGGAATSTGSSGDDTPYQSAIAVGGQGAGGGSGGAVTVVNGAGGRIFTQGVAAFGIFAQSIGGGGGEGSVAGTVSGSLRSLSVGIGGSGGAGADGGPVSITTGAGGSSITTTGKHGIGILAQSIGGGGGLVRTMTTDQTFDPSKIIVNPQGRLADIHGLTISLGGKNGAGGRGGDISVTTSGLVSTQGLGAHGILAQSIGGGGGAAIGGQASVAAGGVASGNGGAVNLLLQPGTNITTSGYGAYGVLAQSIGGGGGLAGDLSFGGGVKGTTPLYSPSTKGILTANPGNSAAVTVTLQNATVQTAADRTPAIFAQSVGGGGGLVSRVDPNVGILFLESGSAGGAGAGAGVTVVLASSQVAATGPGSAGILAQSDGTSSGPIRVSLDAGSVVRGGQLASPFGQNPTERDSAAIRLRGGTNNQITNAGRIESLDPAGFAILADTRAGNTTVTNTGTITGNVHFSDSGVGGLGGVLDNRVGGVLDAPQTIRLGGGGTLQNSGTLHVGGAGQIGTTVLTGQLVQGPTGRLVVDTNHAAGTADLLSVLGSVRLGGTVEVNAATIANRAVTVLSATESLVLDPGLASNRTHLFRFDAQQAGNSLQVQPVAEFSAAASPLGANQRQVASHLQQVWDSGAQFDAGFAALAGVADRGRYSQALNSLSHETVGAIAATRVSSSHNFIANMLNDCPTFEGAGVTQDQASCGWARVFGSSASQGGTGDSLGYRTSAFNVQAGGQREIAPGWYAGGTVAYEASKFKGGDGTSRVTGDSLLVGGILRYQAGPWQISGVLDFGYGWHDSKRTVTVGAFGATASASPNAWHVGAHTRLAYQHTAGGVYLQPRIDLHLTHVRSSGYSEKGAGPFDLSVEGASATTFVAVPAIEVGSRIPLGSGKVLRPFASAGLAVSGNRDWVATARFASQPASQGFRATTPVPNVLGTFTLGVEILSTARWDFRLNYTAEVGNRFDSHSGMGRLAYRF